VTAPARPLRLPQGKRAVVLLNIAYEAWSEGRAPGLGPMGNPLPAGVFDTNAASFGEYGWRSGIWRLLDVLGHHRLSATVFASGRIAELNPESLRAAHEAGHEIAPHSYAQDIIPALLDREQEKANLDLTLERLGSVVGRNSLHGWLSPRCTPSEHTGRLLAESGLYMKHGQQPRRLLETFADTLDWVERRESGVAHLDVTVHAHVFGRPYGAWVFDEICAGLARRPEIWTPTRNEFADWFRRSASD
jgi:peptidoglycan/xylan/chitin deacetylase (PgdA/CDA1 family)